MHAAPLPLYVGKVSSTKALMRMNSRISVACALCILSPGPLPAQGSSQAFRAFLVTSSGSVNKPAKQKTNKTESEWLLLYYYPNQWVNKWKQCVNKWKGNNGYIKCRNASITTNWTPSPRFTGNAPSRECHPGCALAQVGKPASLHSEGAGHILSPSTATPSPAA